MATGSESACRDAARELVSTLTASSWMVLALVGYLLPFPRAVSIWIRRRVEQV
jgi:hypothetical protein